MFEMIVCGLMFSMIVFLSFVITHYADALHRTERELERVSGIAAWEHDKRQELVLASMYEAQD